MLCPSLYFAPKGAGSGREEEHAGSGRYRGLGGAHGDWHL